MKSVTRILVMSLVLGLLCATAGSVRSAQAAEPVTITYTDRVPVYQPPVAVYRPAEVVYSPAPTVYVPPSATVVHDRGPLGLFPRQTVYYSSGGYYVPAPAVVPAPTVIIPR